jgi:HPt (histidine-containing phosphotransfer) domain-containing protein
MTSPSISEKNQVRHKPANQMLDHSILLSVVDGDGDLLRGICGLFLEGYPVHLSMIREAITCADGKALARSAHTLKGSGGFFLTESAQSALADLEAIGQGGDLNRAPQRLADLEQEMELLEPELVMLAGESR